MTAHLPGGAAPVPAGTVELTFVSLTAWEPEDGQPPDGVLEAFEDEDELELGPGGRAAFELPPGTLLRRLHVRPPEPEEDTEDPLLGDCQFAGFHATRHDFGPDEGPLVADRALAVEVDAGLRVSGRVIDAETRLPIAGALVATQTLPFDHFAARTGEAGEFLIAGIDPEDARDAFEPGWQLSAHHPHYLRTTAAFPRDPDDPPAGMEDVVLELQRGVFWSGRVIDAAGRGVQGAEVLVLLPGEPLGSAGRTLGTFARCHSEAEGAFQLPALHPVRGADLLVRTRRASGSHASLLLPDQDLLYDRDDLVLQLGAGVEFVLCPTYPDGAAVARDDFAVLLVDPVAGGIEASWHGKGCQGIRAAAGREHAFEVRARSPRGVEPPRYYRGAGVALAESPEPARREIAVPLEPFEPEPVPPRPEGVRDYGLNAEVYFQSVLDLELLDAATDRPLAAGTRTRLQRAGHGWVAAPLAPGGRIRFRFGPGRQFYEVDCRGYEPRTIELDGTEPGHREITLRMQPQE